MVKLLHYDDGKQDKVVVRQKDGTIVIIEDENIDVKYRLGRMVEKMRVTNASLLMQLDKVKKCFDFRDLLVVNERIHSGKFPPELLALIYPPTTS